MHLSKYIFVWYNTFKRTVQHKKFHYLFVTNRREIRSGSMCPVAHCTPLPPTYEKVGEMDARPGKKWPSTYTWILYVYILDIYTHICNV